MQVIWELDNIMLLFLLIYCLLLTTAYLHIDKHPAIRTEMQCKLLLLCRFISNRNIVDIELSYQPHF